MRLVVDQSTSTFPAGTRTLLPRIVSPLCGLTQSLGFILRSGVEPAFFVAGAELAGVHVLLGQPAAGSYHIGGAGVFLNEAVIRSLGESVERYAQFVAGIPGARPIAFASYTDMKSSGQAVLSPTKLRFFGDDQYSSPGFRHHPFDPSLPFGWVQMTSMLDQMLVWVPAQLVLVGYSPRSHDGEGWLLPAVTTGTAAHTDPDAARRNALLELVQVDAVMGHWYSTATAPEILLDARTRALTRLIDGRFSPAMSTPRFFWLASPDLNGFVVACAIGQPGNGPAIALGLGADLTLSAALYKALLEAIGCVQLAKLTLVSRTLAGDPLTSEDGLDPLAIYDLDTNVAYYALPDHAQYVEAKFRSADHVAASDLPADVHLETSAEIDFLVEGFRKSRKELYHLELTTDDIRELGFVASRVWSPDTLSLSMPSAPPVDHPRFADYGGVDPHYQPHPYP